MRFFRRHRQIIITLLILLAFMAISAYVFSSNFNRLNRHLQRSIGETAMDYATYVSLNLRLTDQEVQELYELPYNRTSLSSAYDKMEGSIGKQSYAMPIKYVYILAALKEDQVKFTVNDKNKAFYKEKAGTPLDGVWLVEYAVRPDEFYNSLNVELDEQEIYRYLCLSETQKEGLEEKKTFYEYAEDGWGKCISGYTPFYSASGEFVGLLGADFYLDEYEEMKKEVVRNLIFAYLLVVGSLIAGFFILYGKFLKIRDEQIYRDPLTSAYNRRYFNEMFEDSLNIRKNMDNHLLIVMFDIDFFKKVNDTYGHETGDLCLKAISSSISKAIGEPPNILVRYGGEEFLAAITVTSRDEASMVLEVILDNIRNSDYLGNGSKITISAGGALLPYSKIKDSSMNFVIKRADDNLYFAKRNGRDKFILTDYVKE